MVLPHGGLPTEAGSPVSRESALSLQKVPRVFVMHKRFVQQHSLLIVRQSGAVSDMTEVRLWLAKAIRTLRSEGITRG